MGFAYSRGYKMSYKEQGLIYFTCQNYRTAAPAVKRMIDELCAAVGGEDYAAALHRMVTTDATLTKISMEYYVSVRTLYRLRQVFYAAWRDYPRSLKKFKRKK